MDPFHRHSRDSRFQDSDFPSSRYEWTMGDQNSIRDGVGANEDDHIEGKNTIKLFGQSLPVQSIKPEQSPGNTASGPDTLLSLSLQSQASVAAWGGEDPWGRRGSPANLMAAGQNWQQSPPSGSLSLPIMESMRAHAARDVIDLQRIQTWPLDYEQTYMHAAVAQSRQPYEPSGTVPFSATYNGPDLSAALIPKFQVLGQDQIASPGGDSRFHDFLGTGCATDRPLDAPQVHAGLSPGPSSDSQGQDAKGNVRVDDRTAYREDEDLDLRKFPNREDVRAKMDPKILKRRMQGRLRQARYAQRKKMQAMQLMAARASVPDKETSAQPSDGSGSFGSVTDQQNRLQRPT